MKNRAIVLLALALTTAGPALASDVTTFPTLPAMQIPAAIETVKRESDFTHRISRPQHPNGRTIVLMHGSGGDESTLIPLAAKIDPHATLIGIRGRVVQEGVKRWYKRITPTSFDQTDIRAEAAAFASFFRDLSKREAIDLGQTTFLGYSNGANLINALSVLEPDMVERAVLLRSMPILDAIPAANLGKAKVLTITGENDKLYAPFGPKLEAMFRACGADVVAKTISAGHEVGDEDARIASEWLAGLKLASAK
jgi:phospholipase/carboxylesterase